MANLKAISSSATLTSSLIEIEPHTAITNQPEESKEKDNDRKNIRKVTLNSNILKNKPEDRDSNFLVVFSSSKPKELLRKETDSLMLAPIRDDTWNVHKMQHIIPILIRWNYSDIPSGGHK